MTLELRRFRVKMRDAMGNAWAITVRAYNENDAVLLANQELRKARKAGDKMARKMQTAVSTMAIATED